jgi:hypothetical protein
VKHENLEPELSELEEAPVEAPPLSGALLDAVAAMRPVRTRRPLLALVVVGLLSAAWASVAPIAFRLRPDLPYLPRAWWIAVALAWFGGAGALLFLAIVPRRRTVLPDGVRAGRAALLAATALVSLGLFFTRDAPPHTILLQGAHALALGVARCTTFAVVVALVPILVGLAAVRRAVLQGAWRFGAAFGAAGGALGGLVLHALCPVGGGLHVGIAHGGGVVAGALLGAAIARLALRRV